LHSVSELPGVINVAALAAAASLQLSHVLSEAYPVFKRSPKKPMTFAQELQGLTITRVSVRCP